MTLIFPLACTIALIILSALIVAVWGDNDNT